ncbi:hypothetical protein GT037_011187 [Alternaria burnsii]|uniref:Uncharacterized protein n=1 Tax=Alternaria burnsii TaxID=1187904 RepID=A0A8H7AW37_9PLEO|nr:uncharacterized protein GT037_011187 [Alternaria burnsii]KAF7670736.1 hypothetical protein GT037_011187 [Alternaria burnsii]
MPALQSIVAVTVGVQGLKQKDIDRQESLSSATMVLDCGAMCRPYMILRIWPLVICGVKMPQSSLN